MPTLADGHTYDGLYYTVYWDKGDGYLKVQLSSRDSKEIWLLENMLFKEETMAKQDAEMISWMLEQQGSWIIRGGNKKRRMPFGPTKRVFVKR